MNIRTHFKEAEGRLTIEPQGRFDFNVYRDFREAYEGHLRHNLDIIIDFAKTDYIDSSALGMLLVLREQAGGDHARINIVGCNREIRKILAIANFEALFEIQ